MVLSFKQSVNLCLNFSLSASQRHIPQEAAINMCRMVSSYVKYTFSSLFVESNCVQAYRNMSKIKIYVFGCTVMDDFRIVLGCKKKSVFSFRALGGFYSNMSKRLYERDILYGLLPPFR